MTRIRIPLTLLAILTLFTAGFALLGLAQAPSGAELAVQNATSSTFGSPPGSVSFTLNVSTAVTASQTSSEREVRLVEFRAPAHMAVFQTTPSVRLLGRPGPAAIQQVLREYGALTTGPTQWTRHGSQLERTEPLVDFALRVSHQKSLSGTAHETAVVRGGYLVLVSLVIDVPAQKVSGGGTASGGVEHESFDFLRIAGKPAPAING
jgi:hypothetical protein